MKEVGKLGSRLFKSSYVVIVVTSLVGSHGDADNTEEESDLKQKSNGLK